MAARAKLLVGAAQAFTTGHYFIRQGHEIVVFQVAAIYVADLLGLLLARGVDDAADVALSGHLGLLRRLACPSLDRL